MASPFRLQRLLRLRTQLRRLREHETSALQRELRVLKDAVMEISAARERVGEDEQVAVTAGRLTPETLRLGREYAQALADRERTQHAAVERTARVLAAKREELVTSHREESQVQRLEERHCRRLAEEGARVMAQGLDELAIERHERARRRR